MPVVWCSDPNSSNKKPTAFALQGIQLQGNLSEQHVLAVRELINAASEGRLLLPSDGGIVLLDCGVGVGSVIIQDSNSQEPDLNKENEKSKAVNKIVQREMQLHNMKNEAKALTMDLKKSLNDNEILYEFLCCARCMNEGAKCCARNANNSKIVDKYLDTKLSTGRANKRPGNVMRPISNRRKNTVSFKSEKRPLRRIQTSCNGSKIPMYATVNKQLKLKGRKQKVIDCPEINNPIEIIAQNVTEPNDSRANVTCRKTSFDSTCTVSSMDSGFMDMQNKLEKAKNAAKSQKTESEVHIKIDASEETDMVDSGETLPSCWNRLTIPSQSRNRRKSYEEFKQLFNDHNKQPLLPQEARLDVKSSIKSRRKSYEEFKSVTSILCDSNSMNNSKSSCSATTNEFVIKNNLKAVPSIEENSINFLSKMKRKNSKRVSTRKTKFNNKTVNQKIDEDSKSSNDVVSSTIYDILRKNSDVNDANQAKGNYDKNLELFKNHCSKNNIKDFDNLLSCGTIYDIIQRKNDIYTKNFKRLDKYMTYGTLYEILHRKSDEGYQFERKRTLSENFSNKRINYAHIDFKSTAENHKCANIVEMTTDTSVENLNSRSTMTSASSMKQGSGSANNQLSITSLNSQQMSTIYDILQTKKLETNPVNQIGSIKGRNRFLVRKITEEDLLEAQKESAEVKKEIKLDHVKPADAFQPKLIVEPIKKQTRIRRFSNILSYTPKATHDSDKVSLKVTTTNEADKKTNVHLEAKIDELYSRLNRITQQNETQQLTKNESDKEPTKIYKSNSLDMLSTLNKNEPLIIKQRPLRKISVPTHQPIKILPKKSTRRLSEFTRGEFLNEKS